MERKLLYWLLAITIFTLAVRLALAFSIPNLTYESYYHLRQVEHIRDTGFPAYNDPFSYGGREFRFLPVFHYLAALFTLFLPSQLVAKLLPNILYATLPLIVFWLARKIAPASGTGALFASGIAGFLPILFTTNSFDPNSLFIPLVFFAIYAFLSLRDRKYVYLYLNSFLLLSFTSSATALLLLSFVLYLFLSFLEQKKIKREEIELMAVSVFFFLWTQFLFFKNTLIKEGPSFLWQNIPVDILSTYFPQFSVGEALLSISIVPFLAGIIVAYRSLFALKTQSSFLLLGFVLSTAVLSIFRLIPFREALALFGVVLAILFALFYQDTAAYLRHTKFSLARPSFTIILIFILIMTMMIPAVNIALAQETPSVQELAAFAWLGNNTSPKARVIAPLEEGHLVSYYGQRRNLMDDKFQLIKDIDTRFYDLRAIYTTSFETEALGIMDKYNARYIMLTPFAQQKYNLTKLKYYSPRCFERAYHNGVLILEAKCTLKKE